MMISIYKPYIAKYTISAINAIQSEWISNHGEYLKLTSDKLTSILGNKYCILMNNGTSATHCLFKALKYKYPDIKKIYVPNHVFIAPWNCCLMEYSEIVMEVMETDPYTLNSRTDAEYIMSLDKDSVVCIVHNLGNIINIPRLKRLRPDLIFIEDNCEGLFGKYENTYSGTAALCSAVSFYGNKTITSGEGGAFFTDDDDIYKYINSIYSHGMTSKRYIHDAIATNFRMTNIQAAFLYDQLNDITHILQLKTKIFNTYDLLLKPLVNSGKILQICREDFTEHSTWMYGIIIPSFSYEEIEMFMKECNIEVRPFFYDIHDHVHLKNIKKPKSSISSITRSGILLPSYPELTDEQQVYIIHSLNNLIATSV
jgi:perosamine synthetase